MHWIWIVTHSAILVPFLCFLCHIFQQPLTFNLVDTCMSMHRNSGADYYNPALVPPTIQTVVMHIITKVLQRLLGDAIYFAGFCVSLSLGYCRRLDIFLTTCLIWGWALVMFCSPIISFLVSSTLFRPFRCMEPRSYVFSRPQKSQVSIIFKQFSYERQALSRLHTHHYFSPMFESIMKNPDLSHWPGTVVGGLLAWCPWGWHQLEVTPMGIRRPR